MPDASATLARLVVMAVHRAAGTASSQRFRAVVAFAALLLPGTAIGGMAVIAHGHVRTTEDIDATVSGEGASLERVLAVAAMHRIEPRMPDALEFAQRTQVLLLVHRPSGVPLDLSLAWLLFRA